VRARHGGSGPPRPALASAQRGGGG